SRRPEAVGTHRSRLRPGLQFHVERDRRRRSLLPGRVAHRPDRRQRGDPSRGGAMSRARFAADHYLVLPLGAAIAIVWANTYSASYFHVAQACALAVNDVGMAFVLAYLAQEVIEAALPGGSLHSWRRTAVPLVAALGGTIGAIGSYLAYIHAGDGDILAEGWPVVCAVDVVLSVAVARAIFRRGAAAHFLLVVAIA